MGKCLGERALNKEAARGIYGLQIRYSPVWTVNLLQPIGYNYSSIGIFPLSLFSLQNLWLCTLHYTLS